MLTRLQARAVLVILLGGFALFSPPEAPADAAFRACGQPTCYPEPQPGVGCTDWTVAFAACDAICGSWSGYTCMGFCPNQPSFLIECYP